MPTTIETPNGERLIVIPEAEYLQLLRQASPNEALPAGILDETDLVDADEFVAHSLGQDLKAARQAAGLTQGQLAIRLKKSQALVSAAERGTTEVGSKYVESVLNACRLPLDWKPAPKTTDAPAEPCLEPRPAGAARPTITTITTMGNSQTIQPQSPTSTLAGWVYSQVLLAPETHRSN